MKIITWNCNMAFRKKAEKMLSFAPDILVLQECEQPEKILQVTNIGKHTSFLWFGGNRHKGLAVISFNGYALTADPGYNPRFKYIVPIQVKKGNKRFHLFAIWANNPGDKDGPYVAQVWKAIRYYQKILAAGPCMLLGDFNSNAIWDKEHKGKGHSAVVAMLHANHIGSCYHHFNGCAQGAELHPTHYLYRHEHRAYHLDYCFASESLLRNLHQVQIGRFAEWRALSDHMPLFMSFGRQRLAETPLSFK